jgi:hypothetical protein
MEPRRPGRETWRVRTVTRANVGSILQRLFDSEIDVLISWSWDGGVTYRIDDAAPARPTGEYDLVRAMETLVGDVLRQYPRSGFARWWLGGEAATTRE